MHSLWNSAQQRRIQNTLINKEKNVDTLEDKIATRYKLMVRADEPKPLNKREFKYPDIEIRQITASRNDPSHNVFKNQRISMSTQNINPVHEQSNQFLISTRQDLETTKLSKPIIIVKEEKKFQGLQYLKQNLKNSESLANQVSRDLPCQVPVIIDPNSFNGKRFTDAQTKNRVKSALFTRFEPKIMQMKRTQQDTITTLENIRFESKKLQPLGPPNYYNQAVIAEYQKLVLEKRIQSSQVAMRPKMFQNQRPTSHGFYKTPKEVLLTRNNIDSPLKSLGILLKEQNSNKNNPYSEMQDPEDQELTVNSTVIIKQDDDDDAEGTNTASFVPQSQLITFDKNVQKGKMHTVTHDVVENSDGNRNKRYHSKQMQKYLSEKDSAITEFYQGKRKLTSKFNSKNKSRQQLLSLNDSQLDHETVSQFYSKEQLKDMKNLRDRAFQNKAYNPFNTITPEIMGDFRNKRNSPFQSRQKCATQVDKTDQNHYESQTGNTQPATVQVISSNASIPKNYQKGKPSSEHSTTLHVIDERPQASKNKIMKHLLQYKEKHQNEDIEVRMSQKLKRNIIGSDHSMTMSKVSQVASPKVVEIEPVPMVQNEVKPSEPVSKLSDKLEEDPEIEGFYNEQEEHEDERLAEIVQNQLDIVQQSLIEDKDDLDEDSISDVLNQRYNNMLKQIRLNYRIYGFAKSPDFYYKNEYVKRFYEKQWLKAHGLNKNNKQVIQQGKSLIKVKMGTKDFNVIPKDDVQQYRQISNDPFEKLSYDTINDEIIFFCTQLFYYWLEDYQEMAQKVKDKCGAYDLYMLNQGVDKNVKDLCLPIDYLIERILQIGLVSKMSSIRQLIEIMLQFDNCGWTDQGPDVPITRTKPPLNHCSHLKLFPGEKAIEITFDNRKTHINKDDFKGLQFRNKEVTQFLRSNLDANLFQVSDRISLAQFLSLFNVRGTQAARKLDRFLEMIKDQAKKTQYKMNHVIERILENPFNTLEVENDKKSKNKRSRTLSSTREQIRNHNQIKAKFINAADRKFIGTATKYMDSPSTEYFTQTQKQLQEETNQDKAYYNKILLRINKHRYDMIPGRDLNARNQKQVNIQDDSSCDCEEGEQEMASAQSFQLETMEKLSLKKMQSSDLSNEIKIYNAQQKKKAAEINNAIEILRKKTILIEVLDDILKTKEIIQNIQKYSYIETWDPKGPEKQKLFIKYKQMFYTDVIKKLKQRYMYSAGLFYKHDEKQLGRDLCNGASRRMKQCIVSNGVQCRTLIVKIALLFIKHKIELSPDTYKDFIVKPTKSKIIEPKRDYPTNLYGWLIEICGKQLENKQIMNYINRTVNIVLDQMVDRESTMSFPNENVEYYIKVSEILWKKLDTKNSLRIPRFVLDRVLIENHIVSDYKQVNRFLNSCLSGITITVNQMITKSQFMKVVLKGILRQSIISIMCFNKLGLDNSDMTLTNGKTKSIIPTSLQVQKYQRFLLYLGIKTKNSKGIEMQDLQDYFDYSEFCAECINNLQQLKNDKNISLDDCKIALEEILTSLKKRKQRRFSLSKKTNVVEVQDLDIHRFDVEEDGEVLTPELAIQRIENVDYRNRLIDNYIKKLWASLIQPAYRPSFERDDLLQRSLHPQNFIDTFSQINPMHTQSYKQRLSQFAAHCKHLDQKVNKLTEEELNALKSHEFGKIHLDHSQHQHFLNHNQQKARMTLVQREQARLDYNKEEMINLFNSRTFEYGSEDD